MNELLEQALDRLRKNPTESVRTKLKDMEVEIRLVERPQRPVNLGEVIASLGPWSGESEAELTRLITETRKKGGSEEPPIF